ncbi:hypothetical protein THAOC_37511 [Thalassiosira oceanica]|uniref:Uncharacterized protein n=1 Tax=Thalassiosira oceanica TaxID=159749 RepID=K0R017_THAOC|nr:hypothetical protein THAOC_37511 [Thalassiosira oceanica]|eukprot:EJK43994.1 hypothetical protein THAOC_37511 [Thalassiosira oceanica]
MAKQTEEVPPQITGSPRTRSPLPPPLDARHVRLARLGVKSDPPQPHPPPGPGAVRQDERVDEARQRPVVEPVVPVADPVVVAQDLEAGQVRRDDVDGVEPEHYVPREVERGDSGVVPEHALEPERRDARVGEAEGLQPAAVARDGVHGDVREVVVVPVPDVEELEARQARSQRGHHDHDVLVGQAARRPDRERPQRPSEARAEPSHAVRRDGVDRAGEALDEAEPFEARQGRRHGGQRVRVDERRVDADVRVRRELDVEPVEVRERVLLRQQLLELGEDDPADLLDVDVVGRDARGVDVDLPDVLPHAGRGGIGLSISSSVPLRALVGDEVVEAEDRRGEPRVGVHGLAEATARPADLDGRLPHLALAAGPRGGQGVGEDVAQSLVREVRQRGLRRGRPGRWAAAPEERLAAQLGAARQRRDGSPLDRPAAAVRPHRSCCWDRIARRGRHWTMRRRRAGRNDRRSLLPTRRGGVVVGPEAHPDALPLAAGPRPHALGVTCMEENESAPPAWCKPSR